MTDKTQPSPERLRSPAEPGAATEAAYAAVGLIPPVALDREALTDLIANQLRGTYHCNRVWEAWHVGTMRKEDFAPVDESDTPGEIADAIIAKLDADRAARAQAPDTKIYSDGTTATGPEPLPPHSPEQQRLLTLLDCVEAMLGGANGPTIQIRAALVAQAPAERRSLLDMDYINSLPQPLIGFTRGGGEWPVYDIEVETGLVRIDVCGKLEAKEISDFKGFKDDLGTWHSRDGFYSDAIPEERTALTIKTESAPKSAPIPTSSILYEHEDGRHAVWLGAGSPPWTNGDPKWHRVGPIEVVGMAPVAVEPVAASIQKNGDDAFWAWWEPYELSDHWFVELHKIAGDAWRAAISHAAGAPTTKAEPAHPDDAAVDALAEAMKAKLAKQRAKGYGGWDSPECTQQRLSDMLRTHVDKGDPVDVANFCAFLSARGEGIAAAPADALDAKRLDWLIAEDNCVVCEGINGFWLCWLDEHDHSRSEYQSGSYPTARAAIDAAIAAQAQKGGAA
ncbi:MAG: hypothetical protein LBE61_00270 [Burkholderiaceae bacterium]|nr:hypothetical protein [Burkholderiaceae bacterium]